MSAFAEGKTSSVNIIQNIYSIYILFHEEKANQFFFKLSKFTSFHFMKVFFFSAEIPRSNTSLSKKLDGATFERNFQTFLCQDVEYRIKGLHGMLFLPSPAASDILGDESEGFCQNNFVLTLTRRKTCMSSNFNRSLMTY